MDYVIQQYISDLSEINNYYGSRTALKILSKMNEEDKKIVLSHPDVQKVIFSINNTDILRMIFRNSPVFFQELMFADEMLQDILVVPDSSITRKNLFENYNYRNYNFTDDSIRKLETFIHTIRSPLVKEQLIENKLFQRVVALCSEKQLKKTFFRTIDEVKLFYNIVNDDEIYYTKTLRKRNILAAFNKASNHILLSDDYQSVIPDRKDFIRAKRTVAREYPKIYVDKRTLELLSKDMLEELLEFENIDHEEVENILKKDIISNLKNNNYDYSKIFPRLLRGMYDCFNAIDYLYIKIILQEGEEDNKVKLLDFIFNILCNTQDLEAQESKEIKSMLFKRIVNNSISLSDYQCLFTGPNYYKTIFYLRFGCISRRMDYLESIPKFHLMSLNVKHINQIVNVLDVENEDEVSNIYAYAIKLYLVFGFERTLSILHGDYGKLGRKFFDNVSSLDIKDVKLIKEGSKYLPAINQEFIRFMFAKPKDNHFREMLALEDSFLSKNWSYLYNNFNDLKDKCHGIITLKKLNIIFKQLSPMRDIKDVSPDNYKLLENDIINDVCLGNKTTKSNEEIYKILLDIYDKMKKRTESSIPYIEGQSSNGYYYEMMKLNDPIVFTLGYKGNCCIRIADIAHNHLLHATLCRNGRILLIYDEFHNLKAFVPLKRNGEVLIVNSVECLHKKRNDLAVDAFMDAVKLIIDKTSLSDEPINLVCIGTEAYARPEGREFPRDVEIPNIFEKDDATYSRTDEYHKNLTILYQDSKLDLKNIKYGNPLVSYQDPRNSVTSCDFSIDAVEEIKKTLNVINAVRYTNADIDELENFKLYGRYGIRDCVYGDDWYILSTNDGSIWGDYIDNDVRAEKEFNIALDEYKKTLEEDYLDDNSNHIHKFR